MTAAQCGAGIVVSMKDDATPTPAYQVIAGLRTRRIALNAEMVDVTNADSTGRWREVLDTCGVRSATISGDGVFASNDGLDAVTDAYMENELRMAKILIPGWGTFEGTWKVTQLESGGEYNGEVTFSVTFESAGEITFTAV